MAISLSSQTQKLIEERMKETGVASADELVQLALESFSHVRAEDLDDLDEETRAALAEAFAQSERGEGTPWEEVRAKLEAKYLRPE